MKKVIIYLLFFLSVIIGLWLLDFWKLIPQWPDKTALVFNCILAGGLGGIIYCLRAVYLNACVKKFWDKEWETWYYIRPIVSLICGGISWLFLKAGLLVLDATQGSESSNLGFLALAFIAGYNVDKFMGKLEQISEATWGIEKSRSSKINTELKSRK